jgi:hypothetical protein
MKTVITKQQLIHLIGVTISKFWTEIEKYISLFRKVYIVGGEPLSVDARYGFYKNV